ncbi:hypothetical protein RQP46_007618 [Phenoliferia psychrophenolica]
MLYSFLSGVVPLAFLALSALALLLIAIIALRRRALNRVVSHQHSTSPASTARKPPTIREVEEDEIRKAAAVVSGAPFSDESDNVKQVSKLVVSWRRGEDGSHWLAFGSAAWAWTFALTLANTSLSWAIELPVDYFVVPWLLFASVASFLDVWSAVFSTRSPSFTLDVAIVSLTILITVLYLTAARPSPAVHSPASPLPPPLALNASLLSQTTFSYLDSFLYKMSFPRPGDPPYSLSSVPDLEPGEKSAPQMRDYRDDVAFLNAGRLEAGKKPRGLLFSLLWYNRELLLLGHVWSWVKVAVVALPAYGIKTLLDLLGRRSRGEEAPTHVAVLIALGIALAQLTKAVATVQYQNTATKILMRTRALLISEIFAKALRRGGAGTHATAAGANLTNIVGSDVDDVAPALSKLNTLFPEHLGTICVSMLFLINIMGVSAFAGVATLLLAIGLQSRVSKVLRKYQIRMRKASDARIALVTDVIHGIRLVKCEGWEAHLKAKMAVRRKAELDALWAKSLVVIIADMITGGVPIVVAVTTFLFHTQVLHRDLDAASAFASLALLDVIRAPLEFIIGLFLEIIASLVALQRIEAFLLEPDSAKWSLITACTDDRIGFEKASFAWSSSDSHFRLHDITLDFPRGKMSVIVGRVGSGKSTLLASLLGEANLLEGSVFLPSTIARPLDQPLGVLTNSVAYCAQSPWVLSGTISDNILFGLGRDERRYQQVLEACALQPDLALFELGDQTEVGERGVVLSGGQKARISLARA